jgi:YaiO family outer membrane protein
VIGRLTRLMIYAALTSQFLSAQDEEQTARNLVSHQHFAEARTLYKQLLERDTENIEYQIWIARLSAWMKDYDAAIEIYDRVIERQPRNAEALVGKASVRMWQHRFADAAEIMSQAEKAAPEDPDVQLAMGRLYHYQSQERLAAERISRVLKLDPDNGEAKDLRREISLPQAVELHIGYAQDRFSFTTPGNMGFLNAGYAGEVTRFNLQYEEWNRFEQRVRRAGFNVTRKYGSHWWLRGGATLGPGAVVVPRQEYTGGVSRSLPRRFAIDVDYQFLRFRAADVQLINPAISYYFAKPVWVTATAYGSSTAWREGVQPRRTNGSGLLQVYHQVARPIVLHAGYARGSESFQALSVDRLGVFGANTYLAGSEFRVTRAYSFELFYAYQRRSDRSHQTSFGLNVTVKK